MLCCLLFILVHSLYPQEQDDILVPRLNSPVTFDGYANDPVWEEIEPFPMTTQTPSFGQEPSQRTEIRIAHDDDYLYVVARLYDDEPEKIQTSGLYRDDGSLSQDRIGFLLDTFNDYENSVGFFTNPAGSRTDFAVYSDGMGSPPYEMSWNTFWDVAVAQDDEGWYAEFRVPFSSLRFNDDDGTVVMGFTVWRYIARTNEIVIFPAIPPRWGFYSWARASQAQRIQFEGIYSQKPLYITPYILTGGAWNPHLNTAGTRYERTGEFERDVGLDLKYGITNNLTLDLTFNTDFAQVEVDDRQVNLTRFSLFFPEKRLFFQERAGIFEFRTGGPDRLFHSRRIGIVDGEQVRIFGGARLVGRIGSWDLGLINMQTEETTISPSENMGVMRLRRQVFNDNSYTGGMMTSRLGNDGSYNIAYGFDGVINVFRDDYLTLHFAQTIDRDDPASVRSLDRSHIRLRMDRRSIDGPGYDIEVARVGERYHPALGFVHRHDFVRIGNSLFLGWLSGADSRYQRQRIAIDGFAFFSNDDGSVESAQIGPLWTAALKTGASVTLAIRQSFENLREGFSLSDGATIPSGKYTFYTLNANYNLPFRGLFTANTSVETGSFYDGSRFAVGVHPTWKPSIHFELGGTYQFFAIRFPSRNEGLDAHILRARINVMFNTMVQIMAFIQFSSTDEEVGLNVRLRYNPREGNDLYIVFNDGLNTNRHSTVPVQPLSNGRAVLLKYTYTFNFRL